MKYEIAHILMHFFDASIVKVKDESHLHAGHKGVDGRQGNTHFNVSIIADCFQNMPLVSRHRQVNNVLRPCFEKGLHALSITVESTKEKRSDG
jgi:BolA protein